MLDFFADVVLDCNDSRLPLSNTILRAAPDKGFISTMEKGQLNPIIIREDDQGKWYLEAGRKRLLAVRFLKENNRGIGEIAARIFHGNEEDGAWVTLVENAQISDNPISDYQAVKTLLLSGRNYKEIAEAIGKPTPYIKGLDETFAHVPDWALTAILEERTKVSTAKELAKLSARLQEECHIEMLSNPKKKLTMEMVKVHHRLVQQNATAQMMSFSGPASPRRIFTRNEIEKIYDILISNDPDQAVIGSRAYIEELLAQEE